MITPEEIQRLAKLSRIEVSESEAEKLAKEADAILGYVSQVENISEDIGNNIPVLRNVMRDDVAIHTPGEYTQEIMANAPKRKENYLEVKKILK